MEPNTCNKTWTYNEDFSEVIPTRYPPKGVPTRRVPLKEALKIAEEFYKAQRAHVRNAEYCRARRASQEGGMKNEG